MGILLLFRKTRDVPLEQIKILSFEEILTEIIKHQDEPDESE